MITRTENVNVQVGCFTVQVSVAYQCVDKEVDDELKTKLASIRGAAQKVLGSRTFKDMAGVPDDMPPGARNCSGS